MTATPTFPTIDSIDTLLNFLSANCIDDPRIYEHLCPTPPKNLESLIRALERTIDATYKAPSAGAAAHKKRPTKASFQSHQSAMKGKLFERIATELLKSIKCFEAYTNVHTSTNEIDILVTLGNSANWISTLRHWGTHFVCECKFHDKHISTNWVGKLNTVLTTHGAHVGILISKKGIAPIGRGTQIRHQLQLLAVAPPPHFIIPLDFADLRRCAAGENLLSLLSKRFVEVRTGAVNFAALMAA